MLSACYVTNVIAAIILWKRCDRALHALAAN